MNYDLEAARLKKDWAENPRWKGIKRGYTAEDVVRLRGSVHIEHTLARRGAEKLWKLVNDEPFVNTLGALTGNQAMQQVKAGLKAIYLSGWQVAADANIAGEMYPDQSLYPVEFGAGRRATHQQHVHARRPDPAHGRQAATLDYFAPIVADAEAGFGGVLNAFELMKAMIEAGAAGVHFEDQLASVKKCGHMGGKVLVPTREAVEKLVAARLAADCLGVPTILLARTDAEAADLLDVRHRRQRQAVLHRRAHGRRLLQDAQRASSRRCRAASPTRAYADLIWCETGKPDLAFAKAFADAIHAKFPGQDARVQLLAVVQLEEEPRRRDDRAVPARARRDGLQVPVHHARGLPQPQLLDVQSRARLCAQQHERRSSSCRRPSSPRSSKGFTAIKHQREVGTGYFDTVTQTVQGSQASTTALKGSTEDEQFFDKAKKLQVANG